METVRFREWSILDGKTTELHKCTPKTITGHVLGTQFNERTNEQKIAWEVNEKRGPDNESHRIGKGG